MSATVASRVGTDSSPAARNSAPQAPKAKRTDRRTDSRRASRFSAGAAKSEALVIERAMPPTLSPKPGLDAEDRQVDDIDPPAAGLRITANIQPAISRGWLKNRPR